MAINIKFDLIGNPEPPTIILANRNGNKLGQLKVNSDSIDLSDKFNDASELSFTVNKYADDELTPLWDKLVDFKLIYCKEWDLWFECKVEVDEETESVKTVFCTQLGQAELSQINLYNIEINTEKDIERDDYKISILWDTSDPKSSILDRLLDKAPHYSIIHVDDTIKNIQRSFSFDGVTIHDAFQDIAEEIGCLFVYNSNSDENGKIQRTISVYDLQQNCLNASCKHRGEFTDKCPKCGGTNIKQGYGEDTLIFVTSDELASEGIQLTTDTDSVKNCFKLEAGDDLMTATIRNCNPNGSDYIWRFSDMIKEDMSGELVDKIESYDETYQDYYNDYESNINTTLLNKYNALVTKYSAYKEDLQQIATPIKGYSSLMNAYYNTIDLALYLESSLMPSVEMSDTNAASQAALLTKSALSPVAVNTDKLSSVSLATANSAVLSMAKIIVRSTYKVEVNSSSISSDKKTWTGNFVVTNYSDEEDTAISSMVSVTINNNTETFIQQKIEKSLNAENTEDYSISGLFKKDYSSFCAELKKYALNPLTSFYDACDSCLSVLIDQGAGNQSEKPDLYENLYQPYYNRSVAIAAEIKIRENELSIIEGVWDNSDENNPVLKTKGLKHYIEDCRNVIQNALNFEQYLGEELWTEFCSYRREDTYSNSNYISDGLNNAELFEKALEFIEVAENEIYKSSELQCSISTDLNNLLSIDKFSSLINSFKLGNWIRVQIDEEIYKLRLIEYGIDFGSLENISVEFSDVTKIKNGISDIESILSQASSMATSYDSVQRQAKQGDNAKTSVDQWLTNGLNSALVRIKSNNNEEVTLGKNGLLCRSYDDITESYSPEQFRLTHNIMAYTSDNWNTVSTALGKHDYDYYDSNKAQQKSTDYGLSAKFVTAGYINGSQIIGGEIYSQNYNSDAGTYMNLNDGNFSWAGGKIKYDGRAVTLSGVTIQWDNINDVPITSVNGLNSAIKDLDDAIKEAEKNANDYTDDKDSKIKTDLTTAYETYANSKVSELDTAVGKYLGLGGSTLIGSTYVVSPYIGGGYLNITNNTNSSRVIIDPNNLTGNNYIFQVHNGKSVTLGIDKDGNASFTGAVTATSLTLGSSASVPSNKVDGLSKVATSGSYSDLSGKPTIPSSVADLGFDTSKVIYKGDITQTTKKDSNGLSYIETSVPSSNGKTITYSTYNAGDYIVFGRSKGINSDGKNYIAVSTDGLLTARNALIYGTIYATDGEFTGKVTADEGNIGGWTIGTKSLKYETSTATGVGTAGTMHLCPSGTSSKASIGGSDSINGWGITVGSTFGVTTGGALYSSSGKIGGWNISSTSLSRTYKYGTSDNMERSIFIQGNGTDGNNAFAVRHKKTSATDWTYDFYVRNNGALYANNATITGDSTFGGTLDAVSGSFTTLTAGTSSFSEKIVKINANGQGYIVIGDPDYKDDVMGEWVDITIRPAGNKVGNIGTPNHLWDTVYAKTGSINSSDRNMKQDIAYMDDIQEELFNSLKPVTFKFIDSNSGRTHYGFISQDVEDSLKNIGLTGSDFAGFCKDSYINENNEVTTSYSLRYTEFIALNTHMIQRLQAENKKLKERIDSLEDKLQHLL